MFWSWYSDTVNMFASICVYIYIYVNVHYTYDYICIYVVTIHDDDILMASYNRFWGGILYLNGRDAS